MSDNGAFNFGKFVPGFDFLQNLAQSSQAGASTAPPMSHWVAPTLSVEDLDKRISELRTVHFWLEQNARAVNATVQALEVQKMTLNTLQGMNMNLGDLAKAFTIKGGEGLAGSWFAGSTPQTADAASAAPAATPAPEAAAPPPEAKPAEPAAAAAPDPAAQAGVDPMQWWGSLSQQFQQIATQAMQDVARRQAQQREAVASTARAAAPAGRTRSKAPTKPGAKPGARASAAAAKKAGAKPRTKPRA